MYSQPLPPLSTFSQPQSQHYQPSLSSFSQPYQPSLSSFSQPYQPSLSTFSQQPFLQPTILSQQVPFVTAPPFTRNVPLIVSTSGPALISVPTIKQKSNYVPFITTDPLNPFGAVVGTYQNLDDDKEIHKKVTSDIYKKLVKKWFYDSLLPLLAFVKSDNGKLMLIKSMNEYNPQSVKSESVSNIEKRIEYMQDKIITHKDLRHFLKKFVKHHDYHWYTLYTAEDKIKDELHKHLKKLLESAINEVSKTN
jgi:hypothetical protein